MKPAQARRLREAREAAQAARGEALEAFLRTGEPADAVRPELIRAEAGKRRRALDDVKNAMARLVYVERVLDLDDLERAALTPTDLYRLSFVSREDLARVWVRMAGRSEVETG
jgi:hypothetical protein